MIDVAGSNYPLPADLVAPVPFDIGTYVAMVLEEFGYPHVTAGDKERLSAALDAFLYKQPTETTR